jgi:hypothetical protein
VERYSALVDLALTCLCSAPVYLALSPRVIFAISFWYGSFLELASVKGQFVKIFVESLSPVQIPLPCSWEQRLHPRFYTNTGNITTDTGNDTTNAASGSGLFYSRYVFLYMILSMLPDALVLVSMYMFTLDLDHSYAQIHTYSIIFLN